MPMYKDNVVTGVATAPAQYPPIGIDELAQRLRNAANRAYYELGGREIVDEFYSLWGHAERLAQESHGPQPVRDR